MSAISVMNCVNQSEGEGSLGRGGTIGGSPKLFCPRQHFDTALLPPLGKAMGDFGLPLPSFHQSFPLPSKIQQSLPSLHRRLISQAMLLLSEFIPNY